MPRGRRRKDPTDAPIDGDYTPDIVLNKQKGFVYKWLSTEDVPKFRSMGYEREERGADSARPAYDESAERGESSFTFRQLTLYKAPIEVAERYESFAQREADRRMSTIRAEAKASGGEFTTQQVR